MNTPIQHINPDGLSKNPAFSQLVITHGPGRTAYIGGQNAWSPDGQMIGPGDIRLQTIQTMKNLETALQACGGSFDNLVKLSIYIVQGQNFLEAYQAAQPFMAKANNPPAISALVVAGLGNPQFLIEIEAVAFLPG